ncbi:hypothetical protein [Rhizorhapis sp.]|uniref:hypothetical protein n=1 Tax=Rhizorhapis sp. TaxID=1968842 RepID=UPI002B4856D4|nr:hypothetical protein [Rhizorhapis sp.]HKR18003.1 hypothetical protein [Rhizorhapis sp.]
MPDLNHLLHRQQQELLFAQAASSTEARLAHQALARAYGRKIADHRREMGVASL